MIGSIGKCSNYFFGGKLDQIVSIVVATAILKSSTWQSFSLAFHASEDLLVSKFDASVTHSSSYCIYKDVFSSTSMPPDSTSWFDQCIQAFPHPKNCCRLISATLMKKNSEKFLETNPGLLGEKGKCYLCAMPPLVFCIYKFINMVLRSSPRTGKRH